MKVKYKFKNSCPFCGSDKLSITKKANGYINSITKQHRRFIGNAYDERDYLYSVRCNSCHARGGVAHTEEEAINYWENIIPYIKSDIEIMKEIFNRSEFSASYKETSGEIMYEGEPIETSELVFENEHGDNTKLTAVFHKGTEDFLGFLTSHKCSCGGGHHECNCKY